MILTAKLQVSRAEREKLNMALNRLHGYPDGLVPFDDPSTPAHLEAAYALPRSFGLEIEVRVEVLADGNIKILGLA